MLEKELTGRGKSDQGEVLEDNLMGERLSTLSSFQALTHLSFIFLPSFSEPPLPSPLTPISH